MQQTAIKYRHRVITDDDLVFIRQCLACLERVMTQNVVQALGQAVA